MRRLGNRVQSELRHRRDIRRCKRAASCTTMAGRSSAHGVPRLYAVHGHWAQASRHGPRGPRSRPCRSPSITMATRMPLGMFLAAGVRACSWPRCWNNSAFGEVSGLLLRSASLPLPTLAGSVTVGSGRRSTLMEARSTYVLVQQARPRRRL